MKFYLAILLSLAAAMVFGSAFPDQQTDAGNFTRNRIVIPVPPAGKTPLLYPIDFQLRINAGYRIPAWRGNILRLTGTPGDLYSAALMLVLPQNWNGGALSFSALKGKNKVLPAENIQLLEAVSPGCNPENKLSAWMLVAPDTATMRSGEIVPLIYQLKIPDDMPAGLYSGEIVFGMVKLPVELQVLPFQLPKLAESAGFYVPGHFYRENSAGCYRNFAFPGWTRGNIGYYFRFCASRRINSATLYHISPEYNAAGKADFSELSAFARAMKESRADGFLVLEVRHLTWYANTVAIRRAKGDKRPVKGEDGAPAVKFHADAPIIFESILQQLLNTAKSEKWPLLLIATEEELSNSAGKEAGYSCFLPVLKKLCPQSALIIDNQLGYNRALELDRGHRDGVLFRQYNSWTEHALSDARKDGAKVGSFNFDLHRMSFGFLQLRLNSGFHHQWADQWLDVPAKLYWRYLIVTPQGIISTWEFERLHAGRLDLAVASLLKMKISRLRANGQKRRADRLEKVLHEVTADIPVTGPHYRDWQLGISAHELDLRRAKLLRAVYEAENEDIQFPAASGAPELNAVRKIENGTSEAVSGILAVHLGEAMVLDGRHEESSYVTTGAIPYVLDQENSIKARCSTAEEFSKSAPSYSAGFVAYDRNGLWFAADGNHWQPKSGFRCKHKSDSPDIWEDDTFQFFWYEPERKALWQLLINLKGERTLLCNGKTVKNSGIRTVMRSPINASGGTAAEALIPWDAIGLKSMPAAGTTWDFNYAREFHSWRQSTSFGRVRSQFAEREHWGKLNFTGRTVTKNIALLRLPSLYPGRNRISGVLGAVPGTGLTLAVFTPSGDELVREKADPGKAFTLDFVIGGEREIILSLSDGNHLIESIHCPVESEGPSATLHHVASSYVVTGEKLLLEIQANCASLEHPVFELTLSNGRQTVKLPPCPLDTPGVWKLALDTAGLAPGIWTATPRLAGKAPGKSFQIEILPDFRLIEN